MYRRSVKSLIYLQTQNIQLIHFLIYKYRVANRFTNPYTNIEWSNNLFIFKRRTVKRLFILKYRAANHLFIYKHRIIKEQIFLFISVEQSSYLSIYKHKAAKVFINLHTHRVAKVFF